MKHKVYLMLGSNMGDSRKFLLDAAARIQSSVGKVIKSSSLYRTSAWGNMKQNDFLNQAIIVETKMPVGMLMDTLLDIEKKMGRVRTLKYAPRTIDIDILFYDNKILHTPQISVPHPRIKERRFVLVPLKELSPGFKHPETGEPMSALLKVCKDELNVKKF